MLTVCSNLSEAKIKTGVTRTFRNIIRSSYPFRHNDHNLNEMCDANFIKFLCVVSETQTFGNLYRKWCPIWESYSQDCKVC